MYTYNSNMLTGRTTASIGVSDASQHKLITVLEKYLSFIYFA